MRYPISKWFAAVVALLILAAGLCAEERASPEEEEAPDNPSPVVVSPEPARVARQDDAVRWGAIAEQASLFLTIEHGFRIATDPVTRERAGGPFIGGYVASLTNLHGWGDGDPFIVNYVGHPIQGAISGFIWVRNDPRYRGAELGINSRYWKSRLRAMAFAAVYSEAFEIGPFSEASIGHVQAYPPQTGFVDQVITPTVGTGWMVAEDAVDKYVIRPIERHTRNRWVRVFARAVLNPSRSFANCMAFDVPWARQDRGGVMGR